MKKIFNKVKNNILLYTILFITFNILLSFILYLINIRFRLWFITLLIIASIIFLFIGVIQKIKKNLLSKLSKKSLVIISFIAGILLVIMLQYYKVILLVFAFTYKPEHTTKLDNKTYVAVVSSFLDVDVDYYDYYGPFLMGAKPRVHGYFGKGGYDPFVNKDISSNVIYTYYEKNGKTAKEITKNADGEIINQNKYDKNYFNKDKYNQNNDYILPEEENVLYEKKFNSTILRFTRTDYALGQNSLVRVLRSKDNGKNFYVVTDEAIQVSNEAKFTFLNEKLGFVISTGKIYLDKNHANIYVTNDSGKTFNISNFNYENENVDFISVEKLPYFDKQNLKMICSAYQINKEKSGYENKEIVFISNDNGLNWNLVQKK